MFVSDGIDAEQENERDTRVNIMIRLGLFAAGGKIDPQVIPNITPLLARLNVQATVNEEALLSADYQKNKARQKTDDFLSLLRQDEIDTLWAIRGGSGGIHVLARLFRQSVYLKSSKSLIGFSDVTALLNFHALQTKGEAFHGPNASSLSAATSSEIRAFAGRLGGDWSGELADELTSRLCVMRPGACQAKLFGGNLCVLASLVGTPWQLSFGGRIAFFEDVNEPPYRLERLLSQLYYAGCLEGVQGVLLGSFLFKGAELPVATLREVFMPYLESSDIPVIARFPAGHGTHNRLLPIGKTVHLSSSPVSARLAHFSAKSNDRNTHKK